MNQSLLAQLAGGDRRSIGQSNAVAAAVLQAPERFTELWQGLHHADSKVRMRAADALEKISAKRPELLQSCKTDYLRLLADSREAEVCWHLAQMAPRFSYAPAERAEVLTLLKCLLGENSSILRTHAMQAIADLSADDAELRPAAIDLIERLMCGGTAAMKARGRKLLRHLQRIDQGETT